MADPQHLTGAQLTQVEQRIKAELARVMEQMLLRKQAVEYALKLPPSALDGGVIKAASEIYDYIAAPAQEVVVRIEQ